MTLPATGADLRDQIIEAVFKGRHDFLSAVKFSDGATSGTPDFLHQLGYDYTNHLYYINTTGTTWVQLQPT